MMTKQEVFDQSATHLLAQMEQSFREDRATCLYRGPDGLKCAVGCLIEDDEYSADMEEFSVETLGEEGKLPERLRPHVDLLVRLQRTHDCRMPADWADDLKAVARMFDLTSEVVDQMAAAQ